LKYLVVTADYIFSTQNWNNTEHELIGRLITS
jgi:hypothetical protein